MSLKEAVIGTVGCRIIWITMAMAVMFQIMGVEALVDLIGAAELLLFAATCALGIIFYNLEEEIRTEYRRGRRHEG